MRSTQDRFVALPLGTGGRWYLPPAPPRVARSALLLSAPYRPAAFVAWTAVRTAAAVGGLLALPRGTPPDLPHGDVIAAHVPDDGYVAVRPALERGRWAALTLTSTGQPHRLIKVGFTEAEREAVQREAQAQQRISGRLPSQLHAPSIVDTSDGAVVFQAVSWRPRLRSWRLPPHIAGAMGELTRRGVTHGDFAPWNLMAADDRWYVIDWESAEDEPHPWSDVWHYIIQGYALIGRPSLRTVIAGLAGAGWVGEALRTYAAAAGTPLSDAAAALRDHLEEALAKPGVPTRHSTSARRRRARLLSAVADLGTS